MRRFPRVAVGVNASGNTAYCYAGPECRLHGSQSASEAFNQRIRALESDAEKGVLERHLLGASITRKGLNGPDSISVIENLNRESQAWREQLTEEEENEIENYRNSGYDYINKYLNGVSLDELGLSPEEINPRVVTIDSALDKALRPVEPRRLYRSYKVPGLDKKVSNPKAVKEYIENNFQVGSKIKWNSFLSTSLDPDLMVYHASRRENLIIFEIVSSRGAVMHEENSSSGWAAKDEEKEVLLPRNNTMRVHNVLKNVKYESSHDSGVTSTRNPFAPSIVPRAKRRFTVIQLVDES